MFLLPDLLEVVESLKCKGDVSETEHLARSQENHKLYATCNIIGAKI